MPSNRRPQQMKTNQVLVIVIGFLALLAFSYITKTGMFAPAAADTVSLPAVSEALEDLTEAAVPSELLQTEAASTENAAPAAVTVPEAQTEADFDFYVLALSWSPEYCASSSGQDDTQQCSLGRKLAFVLHGLWPQYEQGYPSDCTSQQLPEDLKDQYAGLYPNTALFDHEWEKHGTCSGLAPADYLELSRQFKQAVVVPAAYQSPQTTFRATVSQVTQAFVDANPSYPAKAFAVYCSSNGRYLKELYVCFALDGSPRACSAEVQKAAGRSCQSADFQVRNIR